MTDDAQTILREAMLLEDNARADIAAELLASLDDSGAYEEEAVVAGVWAEELGRRATRVLAGEEATEPWGVARDRVLSDLNG